MKTPKIRSLLIRWQIYKWTLVACLALNVFSISSAVVVGAKFLGGQRKFGQEQNLLLQTLRPLDQGLEQIQNFQSKWGHEPQFKNSKNGSHDNLFLFFNDWLTLHQQISPLLSAQNKILWAPLTPQTSQIEFLKPVSAGLQKQKLEILNQLQMNLDQYESLGRWTIIIGLVTLVFGIILPLTVIYFIQKTLNSIRKEIQESVMQMLRTWSESKLAFGDEAFKNVEFWLETSLLLGQSAAQMSSHPTAIILAEMAELLRQEIAKNKKKTVAA